MCKVEKRWVEAKIEREWKTETLTWQVRQTARQAGRQAGKVSAFIHTNYKFNLTLIFFVLQWLLPSYHLWNFWAQPAWWVVLHFLLMITHCQCFLPTVFLSLSISLSFSLLYHSFYCCSPFELSFFSPVFVHFQYKFIFEKFTWSFSWVRRFHFAAFIIALLFSLPFSVYSLALLCIEKHLYKNVHFPCNYMTNAHEIYIIRNVV